jgi:hypothetical protein
MVQIVLQPNAPSGDDDSINYPVDLSKIKSKISPETAKHLKSLFQNGKIPMTGITPGTTGSNKTKWEKVELGSVVLLTGNKKIYGCGVVAAKFQSKALATHLWGNHVNGFTWEYMFALAEVRSLDISYRDFNKTVGYKLNNMIQSFNVLDEVKSHSFMKKFNLQIARSEWPENPKDVKRAIKELDELDRKFQALQRVEQSALRDHLLQGRDVGTCLFCGRTFLAEFLVAAHIKKRSECTDSQKRDLRNIGMLNCKFGCDELYERGYISVSGNGKIIKSKKLVSAVEKKYMLTTVQDSVQVNNAQKPYFAWHHSCQFEA